MDTSELIAVLTPTLGILSIFIAWMGHRVLRGNAKLAADIARQNAELAARLESRKQIAFNRQNWINALREDMALYFALTLENDRKVRKYEKIFEVGTKIELRMNPNDPDYQALRSAMFHCAQSDIGEGAEREKFIKLSQSILKREWDVLKFELKNLGEN